ncbi:hypothetical protein ACEPAF_8841 [Sanghuangporus sanghuang]
MDVDVDPVAHLVENLGRFLLLNEGGSSYGRGQGAIGTGVKLRQWPYEYDNSLWMISCVHCEFSFKVSGHHFSWPLETEPAVVQNVVLISLFSSVSFSLSQDDSSALLKLLKHLVETTMKRTESEDVVRAITSSIPDDPATLRSMYCLNRGSTLCAICPRCYALRRSADISYSTEAGVSVYPKKCSRPTTVFGAICNEPLTDDNNKPLKTFIYNSVLDFIGNLVSRHSTEAFINNACDNLLKSVQESSSDFRDPFQAKFLKSFRSHRPEKLFIDRGEELRLAFSLCIGSFDVDAVRAEMDGVSYCFIALACLNLPEAIRYRTENMFLVGITPNLKLRSDIDRYLSPLVDELLILWNEGVRFSRTASSPEGRIARAAIALVVCDLPDEMQATRISGRDFICSYCPTASQEQARARREAQTRAGPFIDARDCGPQWSELSRLPYWHQTKQHVINVMQCLLLGVVQNHLAKIFPLTDHPLESSAANTRLAKFGQYLQHVVKNTTIPTWVCSVPRNCDSPFAGKMDADEWRTLTTIFLPLAFTLYYFGDELQDDAYRVRFKIIMDHTMQLSQAVTVLFRETTSENEIYAYERHLDSYIRDVCLVHPGAELEPNMHLSTHITDFLQGFGSVRSWSMIPFKNLIYSLKNLSRNNQLGQFIFTILTSFLAMSRLKMWLSRDDCPPYLQSCVEVIHGAYVKESASTSQQPDSDYRTKFDDFSLPDIEDPTIKLFIQDNKDILQDSYKSNGTEYAICCWNTGNSQVIFRPDGIDTVMPGFIRYIVGGDEPKFVVGRLHPVPFNADHFSHYENTTLKIFHTIVSQHDIVDVGAVVGHFAALPLQGQICVVLPLCKVW